MITAGQFLHLLFCCFPSGLLIYGCYGMWHSTLELNVREEQAHASSYQRYDDHLDDTFSPDDSFYPREQDENPYQGWSAPEGRSYDYQQHHQYQQENQYDDQDGEQHQRQYDDNGDYYGYQFRPGSQNASRDSRGRTNVGFDMGEEED